jgi:hypothetical protein
MGKQDESLAIVGFLNWATVPISYYSQKKSIVLCDTMREGSAQFYSRFIRRRVEYLNAGSRDSVNEAKKRFENIALHFRKSDETDNAMKVADKIVGISHLEGRFDMPDFALRIHRFRK